MPRIEFTSHLHRHLDCPPADVSGGTVRAALDDYFSHHPRPRRYILDDQGGLQRHVVLFIGEELVKDRSGLSDPVRPDQTLFVIQALSGG